MKKLMKASLALGFALSALAGNASAQTVSMNALGSSAIFLELGLVASSSTSATPAGLGATCLWTGAGAVVTDVSAQSASGRQLTDTGNAFVAWEPGSGTCAAPVAPYKIYAYVQTDSVVGNRCLFNGSNCTIAFPTTDPSPVNLISSGEVFLTSAVASVLNAAPVDTAGTDIRPEDAEFAITRALANCNAPVATGSQYLGLGYFNGSTIYSFFSSSAFNVINFSLPANYTVTSLGATPVVVVTNSPSSTGGFNANTASHNITNATLAKFLDGTYSYTDQTASSTGTGSPVEVVIPEPLDGAYNTMEYNAPNTTINQTSQDVGVYQPTTQVNCSTINPTVVGRNPLNISTTSGGARQRAIGTGQELAQVVINSNSNTLGYGFWSVSNFKNFTSAAAPYAKYLLIDGIDPFYTQNARYTYTGIVPTLVSDLANVTLDNVANGSYPMWSSLRLVNVGTSATAAVTSLAAAAQNFVPTGTTSARPDFVVAANQGAVHSHFVPPGQSFTPANGHGSDTGSVCTSPEFGGDVGGSIIQYGTDSRYCSIHGVTIGQTGRRK